MSSSMVGYDETLTEAPSFFHCRIPGDDVSVSGERECLLGHQIDRGQDSLPDGVFVQWRWDGDAIR